MTSGGIYIMSCPLASIIASVFNGEKSISKCIESPLSQDYPTDRYEIIVVDNNSTDRTAKIIQGYPTRYVFEDRSQNSYSARNTGVKCSKGDALAFFDTDQVGPRSWLKNL
jgi:glycosyltransferase involved in cell wall biosynthesis